LIDVSVSYLYNGYRIATGNRKVAVIWTERNIAQVKFRTTIDAMGRLRVELPDEKVVIGSDEDIGSLWRVPYLFNLFGEHSQGNWTILKPKPPEHNKNNCQ